mmetsp:Transcript_5670/g.9243  ORF Transcript_5670/g.9243 Transcript_5670/m.9243 type:complete len:95 (+) Transcript_5670:54-338(+)
MEGGLFYPIWAKLTDLVIRRCFSLISLKGSLHLSVLHRCISRFRGLKPCFIAGIDCAISLEKKNLETFRVIEIEKQAQNGSGTCFLKLAEAVLD